MLEQYGVLPYRSDPAKGLEILLVTSRDTGRWVVPKGNATPRMHGRETARREAYEEAGIEGPISEAPIGRFGYRKLRRAGEAVPAEVTVYSMHVLRQHHDWPERHQRTYQWFEARQAALAVDEPELKALILGFEPGEPREAGMVDDAAAALVDALPEPALVITSATVRASNAAAKAILGGVDGQDIRRALRHPAAVERLLTRDPQAAEEAELVGLGESGRRWAMKVGSLGGGALLVRLVDRSEAQAAEQMRVDFVANASHELRTPLATLVGYAETLREHHQELDAETRNRFTAIVHDEARRMQQLVEDLISLSRIEAERFTAPTDALSLPALVEEARSSLLAAALERGSDIRVSAEADLPPIAGDRSQILQMIDNLLSNALRYGRKGTPVVVTVGRSRAMVRLEVKDEGEGIAPEHLPRITERFYRADPSRSRSLGGTGLGLAIVKHIVERHRGRLTIDSVLGVGTSVQVLLPAAQALS